LFRRVLIANRGAIACRIIRTLHRMGIEAVSVYSDADAGSLHVSQADLALRIGPAPANQSYLNVGNLLEAARQSGAEAVHPGYGFLSENAEFAEACEAQGLPFIGPTPHQIRQFGLKNTARELALAAHLPILPGTGLLRDLDEALAKASDIGFPVMLKSAGGGGGIGMSRCCDAAELSHSYAAVSRMSESHFKGSGLFLEKFVAQARHIEVQAFGDGHGRVIALGERDCSVQRRNQKVIEETPAPNLSTVVRQQLQRATVELLQAVQYRSAGTVEFLYDAITERIYFLEVNSRLQVEHGVTEEVFGVDLVEWMVRLAAHQMPSLSNLDLRPVGASIQVRLYAENPLENFGPSSGRVTCFVPPPEVRCDTWIETGSEVTPYYDPLLAKIICHADDRRSAVASMRTALAKTYLSGFESNLEFLRAVIDSSTFIDGRATTAFLSKFSYVTNKIRVLEPGVVSTVQDYPGRIGYWAVGVPPSGPMDALSFRLANRILRNEESAPALECTLSGFKLQFMAATRIAITGADMLAEVNGDAAPMYSPIIVQAGDILSLGNIRGCGARTYVAVQNGLDVPKYLGSAATFTLGNFGGHAGRALRTGDYLSFHDCPSQDEITRITLECRPKLTNEWKIGVLYGPHGSPEFLTADYLKAFFQASWRVHHNSSRTGVRLIGPKPHWARPDGGDAGLHPSNIHDNAYAVGAIDFTGDMPVILGPDGPSLGGFVCPAVVANAELWKIGQLSPGDTVQFVRISEHVALEMDRGLDKYSSSLEGALPSLVLDESEPAILETIQESQVVVRASGDRYLLIEFGEAVLDLDLRFRVYALMQALEVIALDGIVDLTPGIRSLQIHYDPRRISRNRLLTATNEITAALRPVDDLIIPSRIVHLPLSWDDPATRLAINRYMGSVRADAPWCPSNLEFIRRINGLTSIDEVHQIVFDANYMVLGLGDVYLGAPVATPLDPRHRLVTTKYNPARTWTPENAVGIGGAYLCVYGMEGPGGYQFVGRTVQMWNTYRSTTNFECGKPWLLRFFDQVRFYRVAADELLSMRKLFPLGRLEIKVEPSEFRLNAYHQFLSGIKSECETFRRDQQEAFGQERRRWAKSGEFNAIADVELPAYLPDRLQIPEGCATLLSGTTASVWQVLTSIGARVTRGQRVFVLEAMKMEIAVHVPRNGEVVEILCKPGTLVGSGQPLMIYRPLV
jgi:urea carboxylase